MADFYDEINVLVNDIVAGKATKNDAEKKIKELKGKFGSDIFPSFNFEKKPRPWSEDYLLDLQRKNVTGACSEEFIIHMAEVSEEVSSKKKNTRIGIIIAAVIFLIIIIIAFSMGNRKQTGSKDTSSIDYRYYVEAVGITGNDAGFDDIKETDMACL